MCALTSDELLGRKQTPVRISILCCIRKNMNGGKLIGAIYIDLSKAFDQLLINFIKAARVWDQWYRKGMVHKLPIPSFAKNFL